MPREQGNEPLRKPARGGRPSKKAAAARTPSRSSSWLVIPIHATMWPGHQRSRTPRRACDEKGRQQRAAAVNAGLGNELGSARPHQKPEQLVLDGRTSQAGEKRKQLPGQGQISFVAALFASFVCCFQMTIKSLRLSTQFIQKETGKGPAATAAGERRRQGSSSSSKGSI